MQDVSLDKIVMGYIIYIDNFGIEMGIETSFSVAVTLFFGGS